MLLLLDSSLGVDSLSSPLGIGLDFFGAGGSASTDKTIFIMLNIDKLSSKAWSIKIEPLTNMSRLEKINTYACLYLPNLH